MTQEHRCTDNCAFEALEREAHTVATVEATHGDAGTCRRCGKSITLMGQRWLDSDGVAKCEAGHIHSVSGESSMPMRLAIERTEG